MNSQAQTEKIRILIVGATGRLGSLITKHCLAQPNLEVNILVRNPNKNPDLISAVEKAGGKILKGDVTDPESLKDVTKGMHTVISALSQFDAKVSFDGTKALIDDAVRNGVSRFVPSDFGMNTDSFPREELRQYAVLEYKLAILDYLKKQPIKNLNFSTGVFTDSFFVAQKKGYGFWGDEEHVYNLTTSEDTARYVAAAVAQRDRTGHLKFSANDFNIKEINEIYNRVRGTSVAPKKFGSLEDLRKKYEEELAKNGDSFPSKLLAIYLFIYDDRCSFTQTNNHEFPEIKPISVEEFLIQNPDVIIPVAENSN